MGNKRNLSNNCLTKELINEIIDLETNLDKGYPTDTIFVINKCGIPELDNHLNKFNNNKTYNGVIKVIQRSNTGLSFGAYLETYYKLKEKYDYWFFSEDDVLVYKENYIKIFIENLSGNTSFVALSPISNHIKPHCGGGCGLTSTYFMDKVYPNKELPSILNKWCSYKGYDGGILETEFTSKFKISNCKNISPLALNWHLHSSQRNHAINNLQINYIYRVGK